MITLLLIAPALTILFVVHIVRRILFGHHHHHHYRRHWGYGNGYGYNDCGGYYGRPRFGGGLLTILALVAMERLFDRRY